jgi:hypothetical protein
LSEINGLLLRAGKLAIHRAHRNLLESTSLFFCRKISVAECGVQVCAGNSALALAQAFWVSFAPALVTLRGQKWLAG